MADCGSDILSVGRGQLRHRAVAVFFLPQFDPQSDIGVSIFSLLLQRWRLEMPTWTSGRWDSATDGRGALEALLASFKP